ncbi:MAG: RT0821/Lpp0805 family surface protein, partial [Alphaproteobacteria bacterium]
IGKGDGQIVATAVGTLIGTLAGLGVGETLDRTCIASALEYAPDDHTVRWQPATAPAASWQVTPATTWQGEDGRYCREFTSTATVGNQPQSIYGRACRQPDGTWEIVS